MKNIKWLVTIIMTLAVSLLPVAVLADTTAVVNVTNSPSFSQGIISFTVTYVSDTEMDLAWTTDATVQNVMVRAKYGSYPADIPDENTQPSDGYLVYYGTNLLVADTSMNFNENAGSLYYKAWAQKADGTWYTVTSTVSKESEKLFLLFLGGLALVLSYFEIKTRNMPLGALAAGAWIVMWKYVTSNALLTDPSSQNIFTILCIVAALVLFFYGIITNGNDEKKTNRFGFTKKEPPPVNETRRQSGTDRLNLTPAEYKAAIHKKLHPREKD
jgi:hypothetical protein